MSNKTKTKESQDKYEYQQWLIEGRERGYLQLMLDSFEGQVLNIAPTELPLREAEKHEHINHKIHGALHMAHCVRTAFTNLIFDKYKEYEDKKFPAADYGAGQADE